MFGFLKKAVGGLIDSVKKKLEGKPEGKPEEKLEEKPAEEREEAVPEAPAKPVAAEEIIEAPAEKGEEVAEEEILPEITEKEEEIDIAASGETAELPEPKAAVEEAPVPTKVGAEEKAETIEALPQFPAAAREVVPEPPRAPIETELPVPETEEKLETITESFAPPLPEPARSAPVPPAAKRELPVELREPEVLPLERGAEIPKVQEPEGLEELEAPGKLKKVPKAEERAKKPAKGTPREKEIVPEKIEEKKEKAGFFGKLFGGIKKATETVAKAVTEKTIAEGDVSELLARFELELIQANVASEVAGKICGKIRTDLVGKRVKRSQDVGALIIESLKEAIEEIVGGEKPDFFALLKGEKPKLIAFIGFNGSGKTTTIAKVASLLKAKGLAPVIAAGDTFRAAALEQAEVHGGRLGVRVIKQQYGADSAAVIFDAVKYAKAHGADVVLADTAGRQHTNSNLMEELRKIVRVNNPDVKILVVDSLSGSDSVLQAKSFDEAVGGLTGVILTKVDVDEKGGTALSVAHTLGKPIFFLGLGQEYSDLKEFDPAEYVKMVLG